MDPVTLIGLAGSVVSIVDIITKCIITLKNLQSQWQSADWTVTAIIGQLTTLKAALNQISEWIATDLATLPQHYQLVLDLEEALGSCKILIVFIDGRLNRLEQTNDDSLTFQSRLKATLCEKGIQDSVNHLHNQSSALNLLLTALSCRSIYEQKSLLEAKETRQVFAQVKDDSSSLICIRDSASFTSLSTQSTGRSSLISRIFGFDPELMKTQVYQKQLRSLTKRAVRTPARVAQSDGSGNWKKGVQRSMEVERQLKRDEYSRRFNIYLSMQGSNQARLALIMTMMDTYEESLTREERLEYRERLQARMVDTIFSFVTFTQSHFPPSNVLAVAGEINYCSSTSRCPGSAALEAVNTLWKDCNINQCYRKSRGDHLDHGKDIYFLDSLGRILHSDYCPSGKDIILFNLPLSEAAPHISFCIGDLTYNFLCPNIQSIPKKYGLFDNILAHIFIVELASKSKPRTKDTEARCLVETFKRLEAMVNSISSEDGDIILMLDGIALFKAELASVPLSHHFPDCERGYDYAAACDYLLHRFHAIAQNQNGRRQIYTHFSDLTTEEPIASARFAVSAILDISMEMELKRLHFK